MPSPNLLLTVVGCAAMAALMIPIRAWQGLLLRGLSGVLRLAGLASAVVAAGVSIAWDSLPAEWIEQLGMFNRPEWLAIAAVIVAVLFPVVTLLDYIAHVDFINRRLDSLLTTVESTNLFMQGWLEHYEAPGAVLTPERRVELRSALDKLRGKTQAGKSVVRTTLAQLVK